MNTYFELIKEYPKGPPLGTLVSADMNGYCDYNPHKWTEYWQEKAIGEIVCTTKDGVELRKGEQCYIVRDKGRVQNVFISNNWYNTANDNIWSTEELALKAVIDAIEVFIENDVVQGEDIVLYGILTGAWGQLEENTSKSLFYKYKRSDKWKYFRTLEKREEYIFQNKPRFSFIDIINSRIPLQVLDNKTFKEYISKNYEL